MAKKIAVCSELGRSNIVWKKTRFRVISEWFLSIVGQKWKWTWEWSELYWEAKWRPKRPQVSYSTDQVRKSPGRLFIHRITWPIGVYFLLEKGLFRDLSSSLECTCMQLVLASSQGPRDTGAGGTRRKWAENLGEKTIQLNRIYKFAYNFEMV